MTDIRIRLPAHPTLAAAVWPEQESPGLRFARAALLALVGSAVMALSAKLSVPFYPVPVTMQSLAVLLIAAAFGSRLGAATILLYLAEGALGLPVFAGAVGAGLPYMAGPTGGYLAGFVLAAYAVGFLAERGAARSAPRLLAAMALGHAILFALGYVWLAHLAGASAAWAGGVAPFIVGTVVKTLLGALLVPSVWGLVSRRR